MVTTPPPGPYPPQPPQPPQRVQRVRSGQRVWPWVLGTAGVVVLVVVIGAIAWLGSTLHAGSQISATPPTHTYPRDFPKKKLPAQVDGYKFDPSVPFYYQILRTAVNDPTRIDISRSERIGFVENGIESRGGAKEYFKEADEVEPGIYCTKTEGETHCVGTSNSGRVWETWDGFDSLSRKGLARWTAHFIAAVKE